VGCACKRERGISFAYFFSPSLPAGAVACPISSAVSKFMSSSVIIIATAVAGVAWKVL
jgi:hypothetical protein